MYMGHARGKALHCLNVLLIYKLSGRNECVFTEIHLPNPMQLTLDDKIKPAKDLPDFTRYPRKPATESKIERRF